MKPLIVGMSDVYGGAAIASYRLHQGLRQSGHDSRMLVGYRGSDDPTVEQAPRPTLLNRVTEKAATKAGLKFTSITATRRVASMECFRRCDVVNLHNLHGRWFNYLCLPRLLKRKPAVLTLHDMWWFTDGEYYDPRFEADPRGPRRASLERRLKRAVCRKISASVACPSRWLTELVRRSFLGELFEVHHAPLGLDLHLFRPLDRCRARSELNVPPGRVVLMAMAETLSDPRKGIDLLVGAINRLPGEVRARCVLLLAGHNAAQATAQAQIEKIDLGYLKDESDKARAFSASDLLIFPTRMDNLPLVVLEAMACGTPSVSFNVGGVPEMVRPGQTGFLARPADAGDLAAQIVAAVGHPLLGSQMRAACRAVCEQEYSAPRESAQYTRLFEEAISRHPSARSEAPRGAPKARHAQEVTV